MDLNNTLGEPRIVVIRQRNVKISCITMKNLTAFAAACSPFIDAFKKPVRPDPYKLLCEYPNELMRAVTFVSDVDIAYLEELHPDEMLQIVEPVIEMNSDFFIRRLLPALVTLMESIGRI
jgi:hypothetical protein